MIKSKLKVIALTGFVSVVMIFSLIFAFNLNNDVKSVYASTEVTAESVSWSGELVCNDNVTISDNVLVNNDTTLGIAPGKTLTINKGLRLNNESSILRMYGPCTLNLRANNGGSLTSALKLDDESTFILNDGYLNVTATGNTYYGINGRDDSKLIINDGALVVNGGTKAGIKGHDIYVNRGLLQVNTSGSDTTFL